MVMKLTKPLIPGRYLIELEAVAEDQNQNIRECIGLAIENYLMQIEKDVWSSVLPKGMERSKRISFTATQQTLYEMYNLIKSGYERSIPRLARTAVHLYSTERYERMTEPGKSNFIVTFPIRIACMLDELIHDGHYKSKSQAIRSSIAAYLGDIRPHIEKTYPRKTRPFRLHILDRRIEKLDWLTQQGYVLNIPEAIREAIAIFLLEMKGVKLRKPYIRLINVGPTKH